MKGMLVACSATNHGLGNRVRLVLSARRLAQHVGRRFAYVWPTGPSFGAAMTDLWAFDALRVPTRVSALAARRWPYHDESLDWVDASRSERLWQIRSGREVATPPEAGDWRADLAALNPAPAVADRVREFHGSGLSGHTVVGVMVRAHAVSHETTRVHSPPEWFEDRMASMLVAQPELRFFLSCDDEAVTRRIVERFPGAVTTQYDKGAYNSRQALEAAVADLYLLASTSHLLGPHWSSFVHLATYLAAGALPLETSQRCDRPWSPETATIARDPLRPAVRARAPRA